MDQIVVRMSRGAAARKVAVALASGLVVGALVWTEMWFFDVPGAMPWALGAAAATSVVVGLLLLLATVTNLEADEQALVVTRAVGGKQEYLFSEHELRIFGVAQGALFREVLIVADRDGRDHRVPLQFGPDGNSRVTSFLTRHGLLD